MGLKRSGGAEALREVVEREPARNLPGLLSQLRTGDANQRRWAARDLTGEASAVPALGERLLVEADARVREAIFTTLTATSGDAAVNALLPLLRSEDAGLRNGAIEALSAMPEAVGPRMAALLGDVDPDVRIFTVNLMGELRHPQIADWLLRVLAEDAAVNVVAAAIEVLAEAGSPEHVAALQAASRRFAADPFIGFAADMAIQRIRGG
jgi:HEAT repeat protein